MPPDDRDALDVTLHDAELVEELEMLTALIVAANTSETASLTQTEIDSALGLEQGRRG